MYSDEIIERLEQIQTEFGRAKGQLPDPLEGSWWYDITSIDFDPATQTCRFVPDS